MASLPIWCGNAQFNSSAATNEVMTRVENMMIADEPVFFCMADSTNKLCEIKHIVARMVISRMLMDKDAMIAMGA